MISKYARTNTRWPIHNFSCILSLSLFSTPCPILFPSPLLLFPLYYPFYRGCLRFIGHGSVARVGVEDSLGVSLCMCVKPVTPICLVCTACFSAGKGSAAVSIDGRRPISFCFRTPPPNSISARVSSTSPDTNANVSRVIGIFETAVCHCRSLFTRYHPSPLPIGENPTMQPVYTCLPLYFLPPLFFSSLFFLFSRPPLSSSYKSAFNEREREKRENLRNRVIETTLYPPPYE